jgi:hypothetical protein
MSLSEITLPGYNVIHTPLEEDGRGCLMYIHNCIKISQIEFTSDHKDAVWCEMSLLNNDKCLIGCIYRSPSNTSAANDDLLKLLKRATDKPYTHILIMGDFNFPKIAWDTLTTPGSNPTDESSKFIEVLRDCYLLQHTTMPTRTRGTDTPRTFLI